MRLDINRAILAAVHGSVGLAYIGNHVMNLNRTDVVIDNDRWIILFVGLSFFTAFWLLVTRSSLPYQISEDSAGRPLRFLTAIRWKSALAIMLILAILGFGWPSLYRYDRLNQAVVRFNRITGEAEFLSAEGWRKLQQKPAPKLWLTFPS